MHSDTQHTTSPMKQSQSLNSLPPPPPIPSTSNGSQQDVSDIAVAAKLLIERPYNSLKVCYLSIFCRFAKFTCLRALSIYCVHVGFLFVSFTSCSCRFQFICIPKIMERNAIFLIILHF